MSRAQVCRCVGCSVTDEKRADAVHWFLRDVFSGEGVCSRCAGRRDAQELSEKVLHNGVKARATTGVNA